jgi:hypothetical protein
MGGSWWIIDVAGPVVLLIVLIWLVIASGRRAKGTDKP